MNMRVRKEGNAHKWHLVELVHSLDWFYSSSAEDLLGLWPGNPHPE